MVRGYCARCGRLIEIRAVGWNADHTRQIWYPVKHPKLGDDTGGDDCDGVKEPL